MVLSSTIDKATQCRYSCVGRQHLIPAFADVPCCRVLVRNRLTLHVHHTRRCVQQGSCVIIRLKHIHTQDALVASLYLHHHQTHTHKYICTFGGMIHCFQGGRGGDVVGAPNTAPCIEGSGRSLEERRVHVHQVRCCMHFPLYHCVNSLLASEREVSLGSSTNSREEGSWKMQTIHTHHKYKTFVSTHHTYLYHSYTHPHTTQL